MNDIHHKQEIDLLYILGKLKHLSPYSFFLASMVGFGTIISIWVSIYIAPLQFEIEYSLPRYKSETSGSNFESTLQSVVSEIIAVGKLKALRDSSGYIYALIIIGDVENADSAKIHALKNSSEVMNKAIKNLFLKSINAFILMEKSIRVVGNFDDVSAEISLRELENKLRRLQAVRYSLVVDMQSNSSPDLELQDGKQMQFDGINRSARQFSQGKKLNEESLRPIEAEIMSTKADISLLQIKIEENKSGSIPDDSINQFSQLVTSASKDSTITAEVLKSNIMNLIAATEKSLAQTSGGANRLFYLKSNIKNYEHIFKIIEINRNFLGVKKKYKIIHFILGGIFLSLIFSLTLIYYRNRRSQKSI
jgi:hypothetical protein